MEILLLTAVMYWLAAPDKFTAAARTASGTGLKAAGTGAKVHWNAGRPSRQARRTGRRDRWWKAGGWRKNALKAEHAAVWTWGAGKTTGGIAAAAARPVPAAIRNGWQAGQDRHGARAAGKPAGLALDPPTPWWRNPDPAPVPDGTGQDSPQDSETGAEDSPRTVPAVTRIPGNSRYEPDPYKTVLTRQPNGNVRAEVFYTGAPEVGEQSIWDDEFLSPEAAQRGAEDLIQEVQADHGRKAPATVSWVDRTATAVPPQPLYGALTDPPPQAGDDPPGRTPYNPGHDDGLTIDGEDEIRARHPVLTQIQPEPLTEAQRRFWTLRDRGYPGPINQDGWPVPEPGALGGFIENPVPYLQREPIDPPTGTDPDGTTTPTPITTGGTPMGLRDAITESANREPARGTATATLTRPTGGGEVDDLATLQRIAAQVVQQHEESEFMKLIRLCQTLPESADFGDRVGKVLAEFGELCVALGKVGTEVAEMAPGVTQIAGHVRGES